MSLPLLYHGSANWHAVGDILKPRGNAYHQDWDSCFFYQALEKHRPLDKPRHADSVFACADEDLDLCGGNLDVVFHVIPIGPVTRCDMEWGTQISCLNHLPLEHDDIATLAHHYWSGVASENPVWEYLAPAYQILAVVEIADHITPIRKAG